MSDRVIRHDADGLCTLTLNRPDKLNALDNGSFEALDDHLAAIEKDESIGCVVLRGAGRAFCAGADLQAMSDGTSSPLATFKPSVVERLAKLPKPVIAAVHGICFTGGVELVLAADFIVAEAGSRFADTHGTWGLVAPTGELDAVLAGFTSEILANSWHTNFATKRLLLETDGMSLAEGLAHESYRYPGLAPDYKERIARFTKK